MNDQPAAGTPFPRRKPGLGFGVTVIACLVFVGGMVGMTYAAVPLYRIFCQVTGYQGTPRRADAAPAATSNRTITVRFDANIGNGLGWSFRPIERKVTIKAGEVATVAFRAENRTKVETTGTASFNVQPDGAGAYFNKIACFCFTSQTLEPGQTVDMPVTFFVDPAIVKDPDLENLETITLSYTFFPAPKPVAAAPAEEREKPL
jgi:cytochrome c oxidase assembly protein subunit 11